MVSMTTRCVVACVFALLVAQGNHALDNVALRRPASQSGVAEGATAGRAVDGETGDDGSALFIGSSCAQPDTTSDAAAPEDLGGAAWWRVDLGTEYDVYQVVIFNRASQQERLENTWVLVSNALRPNASDPRAICGETANRPQDRHYVNCNYGGRVSHRRGRYVVLQRKWDAPDREALNFCEVHVLSCSLGKWGLNLGPWDCSKNCSTCAPGTTCRVEDGHCYRCSDPGMRDPCEELCSCESATQPVNPVPGPKPPGKDQTQAEPTTVEPSTSTVEGDTDGSSSNSNSSSSSNSTALIAGILVPVLLVVMAIVAWCLVRRCTADKSEQMTSEVPTERAGPVRMLSHQRSTETTYEDIDELELPGYVTPLPSEYEAGYEAPLSVQGVGDLESAQVLFSESLLESVRQHMQDKSGSPYKPLYLPPNPIYDVAYSCRNRPMRAENVTHFVTQLDTERRRVKDEYAVEGEALYLELLDSVLISDTAVTCRDFRAAYESLRRTDGKNVTSELEKQFQMLETLTPKDLETENQGVAAPASMSPGRHDNALSVVVIQGVGEQGNLALTAPPGEDTVNEFWELVCTAQSSTVVAFRDGDSEEPYWPQQTGSSLVFGAVHVTCTGSEADTARGRIHTDRLTLHKDSSGDYEVQVKKVRHFSVQKGHVGADLVLDLVRLSDLIGQWRKDPSAQLGPILLHSANGADVAGLFCVALYTVQQMQLFRQVDAVRAVKHVRVRRPRAVRTLEQYVLLHDFVAAYLEQHSSLQ